MEPDYLYIILSELVLSKNLDFGSSTENLNGLRDDFGRFKKEMEGKISIALKQGKDHVELNTPFIFDPSFIKGDGLADRFFRKAKEFEANYIKPEEFFKGLFSAYNTLKGLRDQDYYQKLKHYNETINYLKQGKVSVGNVEKPVREDVLLQTAWLTHGRVRAGLIGNSDLEYIFKSISKAKKQLKAPVKKDPPKLEALFKPGEFKNCIELFQELDILRNGTCILNNKELYKLAAAIEAMFSQNMFELDSRRLSAVLPSFNAFLGKRFKRFDPRGELIKKYEMLLEEAKDQLRKIRGK